MTFKSSVLKFKSEFEALLPKEYHQNFEPLECSDLDQIIQNIDAAIENIFIILEDKKRSENNAISCVEMYIKSYLESVEPAKYERKKVI